jgi:molybdate transport system ATP-binding protein
MSAGPTVLTVDCGVTLGDFALDARFTAGPGITVLFGPSGAGKTTILGLVAGLIRPDRGRIALNGDVLCDVAAGVFVPPHKRRIGLVFQDAQLFPHLTVAQNLVFGSWFNRQSNGLRRDTIVDVLGIGHLLERRPARLSGGEKSRVALARALLSSPRFLLMDEPLSALDEDKRTAILPLIERVRDEFGVPMLYVTHARDEAQRLARRVVRLAEGRVVADEPSI